MFKTQIAYENWEKNYRFGSETPLDTQKRVADTLASVEPKNRDYWADKFLKTLIKFDKSGTPVGLKCTTGGRITANIGTSFKKATLLNCFVSAPVGNATIHYTRKSEEAGISYDVSITTPDTPDDLINIFLTLMEQAKTLASEGGYGCNFDFIRPRGSIIKGTGIKHPGVVAYMKIWDSVSECIVKGTDDGFVEKIKNYLGEDEFEKTKQIMKAKIRKGAMMGVLSCSHPDCEEFVRAKQTPNMLTKFNLSVLIDDKFMDAVQNDTLYDQSFNGKVFKRIKARELYDLIMDSTYKKNEPGVIFLDNIHEKNPIAYLGKATCTNPCIRKGTLVSTEKGLIPVEEIKVGDKIQTTLGFEPVKEVSKYDNVKMYRVNFTDGSYLDVTEGHIFHTQSKKIDYRKKWDKDVRLLDLNTGDFIRKDSYKYKTNNCLEYTRDLGLLCGLFLGDGYVNSLGSICIAVDKRFDCTYILELCKKLDFSVWFDDTNTEGYSRKIVIGGREENRASRILTKLGLNIELEAPQKTFPVEWLNTNNEFLCGLLDGLISSDGNVNDKGNYPQVRYKSTSLELHKMVRHLMLYFGADYKLYKAAKAGEEHKIFNRVIKRNYDCYEGIIDNDSIVNVYSRLGKISNQDKNKIIREVISSTSLNGVRWRTRILNVSEIGTDTAYDLYVEGVDDWNTCGIVSRGCGEVAGLTNLTTVCLLGSLNLTQYVEKNEEGIPYFDINTYGEDIKVFTRLLDNVNDLSYNPLPSYDWAMKNLRQIGMGVNGLGSALIMLGIPYNSPEALEFTRQICSLKENLTWQTSAQLASEKGAFSAYIKEKFESTEYFQSDRITEETRDMLRKYGARNAKTTTNPPLGSTSILCDNVSNGIEPAFSLEYERTIMCKDWPESLNQDNVKDALKHHLEKTHEFWRGEYRGKIYYYEPDNRGLCEINSIRDYGYQWVLENYPDKDHKKYLVTASDLTIDDHINLQAIVQYYCNQSVSKTANLPKDYPFEDFKKLYMEAWRKGLNGFTTYREGTMASVLSNIKKSKENIILKDIKLPNTFLNGPTKIIKREGIKFYINFSYLPEDSKMEFPVVMWIQTNAHYSKGELKICNKASRNLAKLAMEVGIDSNIIGITVKKAQADYPHNRLGRMVSLCLRHNVPREDILVALMNIEGDNLSTLTSSVRKYLSETLEDGTRLKNIKCENPDCKGSRTNIVIQSGCPTCRDCAWSKCGF